jgi:hypothetical protein
VHRRTELDELLARHATRGAAEFFLRSRGRTLGEVQQRHDAVAEALTAVSAAIPADWRRGQLERADLDRFLFDPDDVVSWSARTAGGQCGEVPGRQPVIGVNPEPTVNPGRAPAGAGRRRRRDAHAVAGRAGGCRATFHGLRDDR